MKPDSLKAERMHDLLTILWKCCLTLNNIRFSNPYMEGLLAAGFFFQAARRVQHDGQASQRTIEEGSDLFVSRKPCSRGCPICT